MKRYAQFVLFFISLTAFSQQDAWVYLNGKQDVQQYLDNPITMLSPRALDRRTTQNIALDISDVPISQNYIDQIEAANGISVMAKSKWLNALHIRGSQSEINALLALPIVSSVYFADRSLNIQGKLAVQHPARKVNKTMETDVVFNYGSSLNQIQMLHGDELHARNYTGSGKVIAIMDGGYPGVDVAAPFARLRNNNQVLGGYDFVNRNSNFYTGISHGTLVLSTMGGYSDNELVGTAPDASYYLFITEDGNNESPLEESLWVEAAEEADRLGADIINTSLGYSVFDNPAYDHTYEDMNGQTTFIAKGLEAAFNRGIICVVSAGNEGNKDWYYITTPADATHALTIGAVTAGANYASFSSHGPSSDGRIKPDVAAQGQAAVLSTPSGVISTASGTSFSGPIMAGMTASFWQAFPQKTNAEIVQIIKESASIFNNPNDEIGYGIPNFITALNNNLATDQFSSSSILVYPNPVNSILNIVLPTQFSNANITLYNTIGQKILQQSIFENQSSILVESLKAGIYLFDVESGGISHKGKLIKQ